MEQEELDGEEEDEGFGDEGGVEGDDSDNDGY